MATSGSGNKPPAGSSSAAGRQHGINPAVGMDDDANKVDFIHRTMLEREASGKRKIKPTYLPEAIFVEDSDDPDFDLDEEDSGSDSAVNGSSSSDSDDDSNSKSTKKSDNDAGSSDSSDDDESDSDSDESKSDSDSDSDDAPKSSLLREMMEKLDKQGPIIPAKRRRKKPKPKAVPPSATPKNQLSDEVMASVLSSIRTDSASKSGSTSTTDSRPLPNGIPPSKGKKRAKSSKKSSASNKATEGTKKKASKKKTLSATAESKKKAKKPKKKRDSLSQLVAKCDTEMKDMRENVDYAVDPLCSICLSHNPTYHLNEVVQCDSCRLNCHEECYCLVDDDGISATASSSSTSPWFCDPCKAAKKEVFCELCPNRDGLFKETGNRLWVHKVCAMYTPGAFAGNQKLPADLSGVPSSKWGGKMCSACDDEILARIGVPVKCDAAMCKEHFHITCAQKLGLLSDPYAMSITNEADPLYISCRAHMSSGVRKRQAEAYKIAQEQTRRKCLRIIDFEPRIMEKLQQTRAHYVKQLKKEEDVRYDPERAGLVCLPVECDANSTIESGKPDAAPVRIIVPQKKPRFLENAAFAVLTHQKKVEFTHYDAEAMLLHEKNEKTVQRVSKMWNVNPGMTVAYAAYYADRQRRITELTKKCKKERRVNNTFSAKEVRLNDELESKVVEQMALNDETLRLRSEEFFLKSIIAKIKSPQTAENTASPTRKSKSPTRSASTKKNSSKVLTSPTHPALKSDREINGRFSIKRKSSTYKKVSLSPSRAGRLELHRCSVCSRSEKQHLIIQCDKCRKHYHLGCLDPPLTKRPRITSTCGWMCADCDEKDKEEEEEEPVVDVDAPRSLRGRTNIKRPFKYTSDHDSDFEEQVPPKKVKVSPPVKVKKEKESSSEKRKSVTLKKKTQESKLQESGPTIKQEVKSPVRKKNDADPVEVHTSGNRLSPVVNMTVNGMTRPKTAKPSRKRRPNSNENSLKNSAEMQAILSSSNPIQALQADFKCSTCMRLGDDKNLVKCDHCALSYHFRCLTPPTEYTPKRKGYKWFCARCDDADDDGLMCLVELTSGINQSFSNY